MKETTTISKGNPRNAKYNEAANRRVQMKQVVVHTLTGAKKSNGKLAISSKTMHIPL